MIPLSDDLVNRGSATAADETLSNREGGPDFTLPASKRNLKFASESGIRSSFERKEIPP
jgi:hypothetical protein